LASARERASQGGQDAGRTYNKSFGILRDFFESEAEGFLTSVVTGS
jgi:hypothetical protein